MMSPGVKEEKPVPPFATVKALVKVTVPVAVRFPAILTLPLTSRRVPGEVVPRPRKPAEESLMPSVKMPDFKVEKARSPVPPLKFWVRMPVIADVVVPLTRSLALKEILDPVEVAEARLET